MTFAERLRARRRACGLTLTAFADACGVTKGTASKWERGTVCPRLERLDRIGAVLGVSGADLLREEMRDG